MSKDKAPMIVTLDADDLAKIVRREVEQALADRAQGQGQLSPVLTPEETAKYLKKPVNVIRRWAREGKLPHFKMGALVRFRLSELNAWVAEQSPAKKVG